MTPSSTMTPRPRIVVLDGYTTNPGDNPWTPLQAISDLTVYDRSCPENTVERAADADIILTNKAPLTGEMLAALPNLRFISVLATGFNIVDTAAAASRGIPVSNVPTYSTNTVAQHTLALILELCHRVGDHSRLVHEGAWSQCPDFSFWRWPLIELEGKRLGLIGYGRISRAVEARAKAFGMEVAFHSRHQKEDGERFLSRDSLLQTSDIISLHCALNPETTGFINSQTLGLMKPSAFLINTGRGPLIDEPALRLALEQGKIAGAALDVLSIEPPRENRLFGAPNCFITPHIGWSGLGARHNLMKTTLENVQAFLAGQPIHVVNGVGRE